MLAVGLAAALALSALVAACARPSDGTTSVRGTSSGSTYISAPIAPVMTSPYTKVMIIAEENEAASSVIGSKNAPYLTHLAASYGQATNMTANYPVNCPSLAAYLIITSGTRNGICDDGDPSVNAQSGDNVFQQVATAGLEWREYAESTTSNCQSVDSADRLFLVRHTPPPYYTSEATRCPNWDVPLGTTTSGALHDDLIAGLPAYSFVTPNTCNEMHGAPSCKTSLVKRGDNWLATWMPLIIASPDFQSAKLAVIITWDEGSDTDNHIPTLVVAKTVRGVQTSTALNHCSTLRASEEILGLPLLNCAATAVSLRTAFGF